ncbi:MAG: hypothetical protein ACI8W7_003588 [Gammaproteobacteria bacterium]
MHPLLILLLLLAAVFTIRWVKNQPREKRHHAGFMAALFAAGVLLLVALVTGKLNPLVAAVAAAIPVLQRLSRAKSMFKEFRTSMDGAGQGEPNIATKFLRINIDRNSGEWTGEVLQGRYKGQALSALSYQHLSDLVSEFERQDSESAALLLSYLDRYHAKQRQGDGPREADRRPTSTMSQHEARKVLGVDESATTAEIVATHRRLMQKIHPDRGGSDYLASKINQAKDRLLSQS